MEIKVVEPGDSVEVEETHLLVNMPEAGSVEVSTVGAKIKVDKVKGHILATSVSGDIRARGKPARASLTIKTFSGDVRLKKD